LSSEPKQNKTKQNKTKQNKTQNKIKRAPFPSHVPLDAHRERELGLQLANDRVALCKLRLEIGDLARALLEDSTGALGLARAVCTEWRGLSVAVAERLGTEQRVVALDGDGGDLGFQPPAPGLGTLERRRELLRLVFGPRQLRTERLELCARIVDFWVECCVRIGSLLFKNKKIERKTRYTYPWPSRRLCRPRRPRRAWP
jgi:hypothetical protein